MYPNRYSVQKSVLLMGPNTSININVPAVRQKRFLSNIRISP
jgi:hypothetical protein